MKENAFTKAATMVKAVTRSNGIISPDCQSLYQTIRKKGKKKLSIEDARALFEGIEDGISYDWWDDFLTNIYTSDTMSYWRCMTEKETHFGDDEIEAVLDAWLCKEKAVLLSNEISALSSRWDTHGFKNGFCFALNFLEQMNRYKTRGEGFAKSICKNQE